MLELRQWDHAAATMQRMLRVRVAKKEAARRRAAVLSIQKARRGRAERAEREEMAGGRCREI